ncbi:hypothetical protein CDAR_475861 [Caerostris darwini]|uniref:Uncharacterized protein n=1 Tax=Caerostris darwini TaxID=1538125 RepID=A0AAV4PBQ3_9ARAC|nr:hypothetical protein CDAR_475861 [Caerostris darwini]
MSDGKRVGFPDFGTSARYLRSEVELKVNRRCFFPSFRTLSMLNLQNCLKSKEKLLSSTQSIKDCPIQSIPSLFSSVLSQRLTMPSPSFTQ